MTHLVLMACSGLKGHLPAPAIDLYKGVMWQTLRAHMPDQKPAVIVLSALHGFVPAHRVIAPYEQRMTPARAEEMGDVLSVARFDFADPWPAGVRSVMLAGGQHYRRVMHAAIFRRRMIGDLSPDADIYQTTGKGIGYQRAQLAEYLRAIGGR
jgi:hypothetical protein